MNAHRFGIRLATTALTALIAALPLAGSAADPFEINVIIPMTGGAAFVGKEESESLRLVEETVNKAGGVRGRPIKFVINDDQTNPQVTVQLTNSVIAKKVPIFFGSTLAAMCNAQAPLVKDGPVMYCYSPSINPPAGSFVFSSMYASDDILAVSMRYLRERGVRRVALLNGTDATGQEADKALEAIVRAPENVAAGMALVIVEHFNLSDITVAAQMARIKAAGAQAIVSYVSTTALATVLHGMQESALDVPIVGSPGNMSYTQMETYKAFAPKELIFAGPPIFSPEQIADPTVKRSIIGVVNTFRAAGIRPDHIHALAWDVAQLTVQALRKEGLNATPAQIRDNLANLRGWYGGLGLYDFRAVPQRGLSAGSLTMVKWDPDKSVFVAISKPGGGLR
jgi:branched-chain amino acid transport system substrate-binding protein